MDRLIVALDYPDAASALALTVALGPAVCWYKVGLELYLGAGRAFVEALVNQGFSIFLDLKLHDIPNQVAGAVRSAAGFGASLLTIHAAGGPAMIAAAVNAASQVMNPPRILAVSVLTNMDQFQLASTGIQQAPAEQVQLLATMAIESGADGMVCSAEESASLRALLGAGPLLVTPGIRQAQGEAADQKRIATPADALRNGSSYLVVGRPITQAPDPLRAAQAILAEMQSVLDA